MKAGRTFRRQPTFLAQTLAAVLSIALFLGAVFLAQRFGATANPWVLGGLLLLWLVGLELHVLPWILERAAVRSSWLSYDADAEDAADRERTRETIKDNPSLS